MRKRLHEARLYGIVDFGYARPEDFLRVTAALLKGGVHVLQLRAKDIDLEAVKKAAPEIIRLCREACVPFILNDHPELAVELGADGVHIGQDDGEIYDARCRVGSEMIIGRSTHSLSQARQALADGADYIGFGPLFSTPTKLGRPAIGLQDVAEMERDIGAHIPAFCIGGIKPGTLPEILAAGARRCVIVSHLLLAKDIAAATGECRALLRV